MSGPDLKVVNFSGTPAAKEVLEAATAEDLSEVLVIGWTKEGQLYWNSSVRQNTGELLHLMEATKFNLMTEHSGLGEMLPPRV
jgi:hypothetical protein